MKTVIALTLALVLAAQAVDDWHKKVQSYKSAIRDSHANSQHIFRGRVAHLGLLPFQVLVWNQNVGENNKICGGSLIKEDKVLTAAHCCNGASYFVAFLATINFAIVEPNRQRVRGSKYTIHENYNPVTIENDLCIIHLDAEVRGEGIATLRLPSRSQAEMTFAGHKATIAGWGETSDNDTIMNTVLRYTDVMTIMKNDDCRRYYELITATMLCANSPDGSGVCMGDSGSPLTITESDGVKTQVGISSFSPSVGCETLRPDGYVRLTEYLDWVEKWAEVDIRP